MSSRNVRLTTEERHKAPVLLELLRSSLPPDEVTRRLQELGFKVDYVEEIEGRRFGAATLGSVRLIDNVPVRSNMIWRWTSVTLNLRRSLPK